MNKLQQDALESEVPPIKLHMPCLSTVQHASLATLAAVAGCESQEPN